MSTRDHADLYVRNIIALRLVTHRGLDPLEAHMAVTRVVHGMPTEHELLVRVEASAALNELMAPICAQVAEFLRAIQPAMQAAATAVGNAMKGIASVRAALEAPPLRPEQLRPAWQSPYGPAQKGHRQ